MTGPYVLERVVSGGSSACTGKDSRCTDTSPPVKDLYVSVHAVADRPCACIWNCIHHTGTLGLVTDPRAPIGGLSDWSYACSWNHIPHIWTSLPENLFCTYIFSQKALIQNKQKVYNVTLIKLKYAVCIICKIWVIHFNFVLSLTLCEFVEIYSKLFESIRTHSNSFKFILIYWNLLWIHCDFIWIFHNFQSIQIHC